MVYLAAGDLVPADVRLLESRDLFVSQSILSGEALPVEKGDAAPDAALLTTRKTLPNADVKADLLDLKNISILNRCSSCIWFCRRVRCRMNAIY